MKKAKRILCVLLVCLLAFAVAPGVYAREANTHLRFHEDGSFTILHLTDWHTDYPMPAVQKQYVTEALAAAKPDLVVLGGDMSEASKEDQPAAVKEICDLMIAADVPFAITFGNHDYLHELTIDELFALYRESGGAYCLSVDEAPALFGCGTCSIPVYANDGSRVAYNMYFFDSGCEVDGQELAELRPGQIDWAANGAKKVKTQHYESVHADQIAWYQQKAESLREANGGRYVPSIAFQHIIVQEIYDKLWPQAKAGDRSIMRFADRAYKMTAIPNLSSISDGYVMEYPCPGYYNYGQLAAMQQNGDVRAIFCGHDHSNSFTVEIDGVDIVNTPSVKPHSLFKKLNWGGRVVTLYEDGGYESRVLSGCELAATRGSGIIESGAVSRFELVLTKLWKAFADVSMFLWKPVTRLFNR